MASRKQSCEIQSAVIYARFSSHSQKDESIEQQVAECRQYAEDKGLTVSEVYADHAVSGKTDRRASFQRMMRDAEKRKFSVVIAYKSNRFGRNMLQALGNEDKLATFGVKVLYAKEEFGDNASGRFALRTMMNVNQFYSENMAEDIRRGLNDNAEKCKINGGFMPFGYKRGMDGRFAIDENSAPIVKEIFEKVYNGEPFVEIANSLNSRGIKTSKGHLWGRTSFQTILNNEIYVGVYTYADVRIEDGAPAIISKELFYKVQKKLKEKKNPQGRHRENGEYLLTGKMFCGYCESYMIGVSGTSRDGQLHYYYVCKKKHDEKGCKKLNVRRDVIERAIVDDIREYIMKDNVIEWIADEYMKLQERIVKESQLCVKEKELADVQRSINNIMTAIEQGIITPTTKSRLLDLESEKKQIEKDIFIEKKCFSPYSREKVEYWLESFKTGDPADKHYQKRIISAFVQAVYLFDDELRIAFSYGENNTITHKFGKNIDINTIHDSAECSYKLPYAPPQKNLGSLRFRGSSFCVWQLSGGYCHVRRADGQAVCQRRKAAKARLSRIESDKPV